MEASQSLIRRQLGRIMVEQGFLTPAQLDVAIVEQRASGKPLGHVLVELGLASAGAVANALAEQHGGVLKTEFGVSAGLKPAPAPAPARSDEVELRSIATPEEMQRRRLVGELDALREQCAAVRRDVSMLEAELERMIDTV
jgi:hypothetical protein